MLSRKEVLKILSTVPLGLVAGSATARGVTSSLAGPAAEGGSKGGPLSIGPEIYQSIDVETIINCRGTFTIIGGSVERPEVRKAMEAAGGHFAQYDELAFGIGNRLSEITGAPWGMVSSGCAAGLKHVTSACVSGGNPEKVIQIPDLTGFEKNEVIIPGYSRNVYDHGVRNIGVKIIDVDTPEEFKEALNSRTAMVYLTANRRSATGQPLSLEAIVKMAKPNNVPVLIDAAAEDLTIPNVHLQRGATIVAYSGGKALCGPQCAGLLLGDKNILMAAWQASAPHHGPGRDDKVGKEEMFGMLAAVEAWVTRDHEAEWQQWLSWIDHISKRVTRVNGVTAKVEQPRGLSNRCPRLVISWDPEKLHLTGEELAEEVGRNKPRIAIGSRTEEGTTSVNITPSQMQAGEEKVVADRLYGELSKKRRPKSGAMSAPGGNLAGRWDVDVAFFNSHSQHTLYIEKQDDNWLQGSHKGDFAVRDMAGTIEGKDVKLLSVYRRPGDRIIFIFTGALSADGNTITGSVYMEEYLTATFTATRYAYPDKQEPVVVPGGPPLAT